MEQLLTFELFGLRAAIRMEYIPHTPKPDEGSDFVSITRSSPRAIPCFSIVVGETSQIPAAWIIRLADNGSPAEPALPLSGIPGFHPDHPPTLIEANAIITDALARAGVLNNNTAVTKTSTTLSPVCFAHNGSVAIGSGDQGRVFLWDMLGHVHQTLRHGNRVLAASANTPSSFSKMVWSTNYIATSSVEDITDGEEGSASIMVWKCTIKRKSRLRRVALTVIVAAALTLVVPFLVYTWDQLCRLNSGSSSPQLCDTLATTLREMSRLALQSINTGNATNHLSVEPLEV